ncbi:hypothetical protein [Pseudomonas sp. PB106]|uniref:hypothetical protein n=1 Tax=Pseudomonas sp. PB106 TaxID=2494699 RepID=UPI00131C76EE|nr:hypothetical protein [Pseudomonas sp. PB106]KAE9643392.1 hypothetical protein EJA71_16810 [Pseudomonas sp. PB106]
MANINGVYFGGGVDGTFHLHINSSDDMTGILNGVVYKGSDIYTATGNYKFENNVGPATNVNISLAGATNTQLPFENWFLKTNNNDYAHLTGTRRVTFQNGTWGEGELGLSRV